MLAERAFWGYAGRQALRDASHSPAYCTSGVQRDAQCGPGGLGRGRAAQRRLAVRRIHARGSSSGCFDDPAARAAPADLAGAASVAAHMRASRGDRDSPSRRCRPVPRGLAAALPRGQKRSDWRAREGPRCGAAGQIGGQPPGRVGPGRSAGTETWAIRPPRATAARPAAATPDPSTAGPPRHPPSADRRPPPMGASSTARSPHGRRIGIPRFHGNMTVMTRCKDRSLTPPAIHGPGRRPDCPTWRQPDVKLSVMQENLARGLSVVSRAVSSRSTLPVLANVLLRTEDAGLKLTATNLEIGITYWVPGPDRDRRRHDGPGAPPRRPRRAACRPPRRSTSSSRAPTRSTSAAAGSRPT